MNRDFIRPGCFRPAPGAGGLARQVSWRETSGGAAAVRSVSLSHVVGRQNLIANSVYSHGRDGSAILWQRLFLCCVIIGDGVTCALILQDGERIVKTEPMPDAAKAIRVLRVWLRRVEAFSLSYYPVRSFFR
jgi:hypothetical protein